MKDKQGKSNTYTISVLFDDKKQFKGVIVAKPKSKKENHKSKKDYKPIKVYLTKID